MPQPKDEAAKELQQRYKNVFDTPEGRIVLGDILTLGHFGETLIPTDLVSVAEYNAAITIARMAGAFDSLYDYFGMNQKEQ